MIPKTPTPLENRVVASYWPHNSDKWFSNSKTIDIWLSNSVVKSCMWWGCYVVDVLCLPPPRLYALLKVMSRLNSTRILQDAANVNNPFSKAKYRHVHGQDHNVNAPLLEFGVAWPMAALDRLWWCNYLIIWYATSGKTSHSWSVPRQHNDAVFIIIWCSIFAAIASSYEIVQR